MTWSPRSTGDNTGFTLFFYGGAQDRATNIEFICDPNAGTFSILVPPVRLSELTFVVSAGVGAFMTKDPSEDPVHLYHLKWATAYACPTFGVVCCHYDKPGTTPIPGLSLPGRTKRDTQSTCIIAENPCPSTLGKYSHTGNTTVLSYSLPLPHSSSTHSSNIQYLKDVINVANHREVAAFIRSHLTWTP